MKATAEMRTERNSEGFVRGLYALTPDLEDTTRLVVSVSAALAGGARLIQYRNKAAAPHLRLEQALALKQLCRTRRIPLIINDDVELALAVGAEGVHLGREDAAVEAARSTLGARALIGTSCYNELPRALDAQRRGADYVAFGSFFPSSVKPGAVRATPALLQQARVHIKLPIVAIGGITADNAPALVARSEERRVGEEWCVGWSR